MKNKLYLTGGILFLTSGSVLATIYLAWLFFPLEIKWLGLEKVVYMKAADIQYNLNILMRYLTLPWEQVLAMPNFSSSANGLHHFQQVKWLFHFAQAVFVLTMPFFVAFWKTIVKTGYSFLFSSVFIWAALVPLLIGLLAALVGFDSFFVLFHQLLFAGDSTWLFNPATDPVIYILPESFFLHCFLLFFFLYEVACLIMIAVSTRQTTAHMTMPSQKKNIRK